MRGEGNPLTLLVGMQTGAATLENSMEVSRKIKKQNGPMIQQFHFWIFTNENKNSKMKSPMLLHGHCCVIYNTVHNIVYSSQEVEAARVH